MFIWQPLSWRHHSHNDSIKYCSQCRTNPESVLGEGMENPRKGFNQWYTEARSHQLARTDCKHLLSTLYSARFQSQLETDHDWHLNQRYIGTLGIKSVSTAQPDQPPKDSCFNLHMTDHNQSSLTLIILRMWKKHFPLL